LNEAEQLELKIIHCNLRFLDIFSPCGVFFPSFKEIIHEIKNYRTSSRNVRSHLRGVHDSLPIVSILFRRLYSLYVSHVFV